MEAWLLTHQAGQRAEDFWGTSSRQKKSYNDGRIFLCSWQLYVTGLYEFGAFFPSRCLKGKADSMYYQ